MTTQTTEAPRTLNGYPVTMFEQHANGYATVAVIRDAHNAPNHSDMVVATWWPDLGSSWMWGHYFTGDDAQDRAQSDFHATATRNRSR